MIAALAGAGAGMLRSGGMTARVLGPAFVLAGVATEWLVLRTTTDLGWLPPVLVAAGIGIAVLLAGDVMGARGRTFIGAGAVAVLLLAPASWSLQTPSYAASGTFPAGGPATTGFGGPPQLAGGGPFGGETNSLSAALEYAASQRGGTVAVASQSGAAGSLITSGADVAALGGFSGRESQVSVAWLADAVEGGRIRWVLVSAAGGMGNDGRIGASEVMAAVEQVGTPVSSVDGLYDLQGAADALRALTR
jgi:hypothetical protein